ncbi:hypothetical protein FRB98_008724 [Tulasnella sp. 332]|nr:hypothetical protein FRB98_008724 [Tulasnella sp. 332]
MLCSELPLEILIGILHELDRPSHPSAYQLDSGCIQGLAQLCLVNATFNAITVPLLYSRVILTPKSLVSFCNAIKVGTNKPSYNYIDKAKLMKSLALVGWDRNEDELDGEDRRRVRQIIDATKLSLVRLFSDISFTTLYEVLRTCSVIEEMCIAERAARGGRIPLIPQTLKRMAVVGAPSTMSFLTI